MSAHDRPEDTPADGTTTAETPVAEGTPGKPDFEHTMAELEETVRLLEAGDLPLEESLSAFEKGIALVRALHTRLDAVQMRIDELTQSGDGTLGTTPFSAAGTRGAVAGRNDGEDDGEDDGE